MEEAHDGDAGSQPPSHNAQEKEIITFAKRLAANEKAGRDQALARLRVWLAKKPDLSELDLLKIWKGLFYCMWMSDKAPVQQELASAMSKLVYCFGEDVDRIHLFIVTYYRTLRREWSGLDKYRLDKYYSFMRLMMREVLKLVKSKSWHSRWLEKVYLPLEPEVLEQPWPNGLRLHLCDLILPELENVAGKEVSTDVFLSVLAPFYRVLSTCPDKAVFQRALERVLLDFVHERAEKGQEEEDHFPGVDLQTIQGSVFELAAAPETKERYRESLYAAHKDFQKVTGVRLVAYKRPREGEEKGKGAKESLEEASPSKASKKSAAATPSKKQKQDAAKEQVQRKQQQEEAEAMEVDEAPTGQLSTKADKKKKDKKQKEEPAATAAQATMNGSKKKQAEGAGKAAASSSKDAAGQQDGATGELSTKKLKKKLLKQQQEAEDERDAMEVDEPVVNKGEKQQPGKRKAADELNGKKDKAVNGSAGDKGQDKAQQGDQAAPPQFIKAAKFAGAKPGYKFQKGKQGVGYYWDKVQATTKGGAGAKQSKKDAPKGVAEDKAVKTKGVKAAGAGADKADTQAPEGDKKPPQFIKATKFAGAKPGYKFQKGKQGVGYYWDKVQAEASSRAAKGGNKKKVTFGKVHVKVFKRDDHPPARTISFMPKKQQQQGKGKKFRSRAASYF